MAFSRKTLALLAALLLLVDRGVTSGSSIPEAEAASPPPREIPMSAPPLPAAFDDRFIDSSDGHAILADAETARYANISVTKTGGASDGEAGVHETNAAVLARNGAVLELSEISVTTGGRHANAVFSSGEDTIVSIAHSTVTTSGDDSAGLTAADGGTVNADNLVLRTAGDSSPAIRSGHGGGTIMVRGGTYSTDGLASPAIHAGSDVTLSDSELKASASSGVLIEGESSVTLQNVSLVANDVRSGSDMFPQGQAVALFRSASGDESESPAVFTMEGGSLTNLNGDIFFVSNASALIRLYGAEIINDDPNGVFLRSCAADWGPEGENGGHVELLAVDQTIDGDMLLDSLSTLTLRLAGNSVFTGAVVSPAEGSVSVSLSDGAKWILSGDSIIDCLSCDADSIDLNGFSLRVGGELYSAGSAVQGTDGVS